MLRPWRPSAWLVLLAAGAVDQATPAETVAVVAADSLGSLLATYSLAELEAQGRAVIHQPPPLGEENGVASGGASRLPFLAQPFFVTVGVELQAGRDYAGWRLCQRVGARNATLLPQPFREHCSLLWVRDGGVGFSPVSGLSPPEYDFLAPGVYEAQAWFESGGSGSSSSSSSPYRAWGRVTRWFEAGPPPPRDAHGGFVYLEVDPAEEADVATGSANGAAHAENSRASLPLGPPLKSPSVVGVIVEPRSHPNLAYVILNVAAQLPAVRPIYLFHGPNFDPCAAAATATATAATAAGGGGVPNSGGVTSAAQAGAARLCELVRTEQLVLFRLRVNNLSFRDYNRFFTSQALWDRVGGDKALVFQTDTVVCSGRAAAGVGDFARRLDYVGGRQRLQYFLGDPPTLVDEELYGGNGGFSLRDVALSRACAVAAAGDPTSSGREQEDVHFPLCFAARGGRVATPADQDAFAAYAFPVPGALGAHKLDLGSAAAQAFVQQACPEYRGLAGV